MAHDTLIEEKDTQTGGLWSGGKAPMKASYGKLMMWYFLLSDAFTFAGFLIAYGALRFSSPTWPIPDSVFSTAPFGIHNAPLIFVTFMSFLLIISSVTMVRAVQEGHRENQNGVAFWMLLTVIGGAGFLGCQAWEWNNLINKEHMSVTTNPFSTYTEGGTYINTDGSLSTKEEDVFDAGDGYLVHLAGHGHGHGEHDAAHHLGEYSSENDPLGLGYVEFNAHNQPVAEGETGTYRIHEKGFLLKGYKTKDGKDAGKIKFQEMGPKAFGALFFFITGFHGFHVLSGVVFLTIIMVNVLSGLYKKRKNGYEMVEKIGLYWHFVDLVWVFVFLVFYLL